MTERRFALLGSLSGAMAVLAGAFGAHALRPRLPADLFAAFETGTRYQMYHALALLVVAWATTQWPTKPVRLSGWLFVVGSVLFSGSLYVLALTGRTGWGAITPLGGALLIAGWLALAIGIWRR